MSTYAVVKDLLQVLIVPISLAVFGYYWPLWLARTKRDAFEEMIWREMDEMNPLDRWSKDPDFRWWQLLPKRFVHERIFLEPSSNREFVLSLDPTLAYHEFQMWTAIQKVQAVTEEAQKLGTDDAKKKEKEWLIEHARQWDHHLGKICALIAGKKKLSKGEELHNRCKELHNKWWEAIEFRHPGFREHAPKLSSAPAFWER